MRRLLSADFNRLWKSRSFWSMEGISAALGLGFQALAVWNGKRIGEEWYLGCANYYFYLVLIFVGMIMAIFSGFFIGAEYTDGTFRNKLSVGHSRTGLYLANFFVSIVAGILFILTNMIASVCVGPLGMGKLFWQGVAVVGWRILTVMVMVICYGALFTFFSMLDHNKARNLIITFSLALLLILGGLYTGNRLREPEFISRMVEQEDGSYQRMEGFPNKYYVSGAKRELYTLADACMPASQAFNIAREEGELNVLSIGCLLGVSALFTVVGLDGFRKKDIK